MRKVFLTIVCLLLLTWQSAVFAQTECQPGQECATGQQNETPVPVDTTNQEQVLPQQQVNQPSQNVIQPQQTEATQVQTIQIQTAQQNNEQINLQSEQNIQTTQNQQPTQPAFHEESGPNTHEGFIPTVSVRYGSLSLLGILQSRIDLKFVSDDIDNEDFNFLLQRARIILKGHVVSENLQYFFQGEATNSDTSFILDGSLTYNIPSWNLSIKGGRLIPEFSIMMPRNTADLGTINYPIYLTDANFTLWRQIGLQLTYKPVDLLSITFGMFNGMGIEPSAAYRYSGIPNNSRLYMGIGSSLGLPEFKNYEDNNKWKDFVLKFDFSLVDGLTIGINSYLSFARSYTVSPNSTATALTFGSWSTDEDTFDLIYQGGLSIEYKKNNIHLAGEFMLRYISFDSPMPTTLEGISDPQAQIDTLMSLGAWLHFGYLYDGWLEPVVRVDWMDPALNSKYDNDQVFRFTIGPQFWLEQDNHFRILVNYFVNLYYQNDNKEPDHNVQVQLQALW